MKEGNYKFMRWGNKEEMERNETRVNVNEEGGREKGQGRSRRKGQRNEEVEG